MWARLSERLVRGLAAESSMGCVGGGGRRGGVWALVTMMFVDYTQPQMMCRPAHITMNASLSHYLYIMATTPLRGQASSRLINPLTARPKEKWGARQRCSPLIHRLYLTAPASLQNAPCDFWYLLIHGVIQSSGKCSCLDFCTFLLCLI